MSAVSARRARRCSASTRASRCPPGNAGSAACDMPVSPEVCGTTSPCVTAMLRATALDVALLSAVHLEVRSPQLGEGIAHRLLVLAEPAAHAVEEGPEGVDRHARLRQLRLRLHEVEGGQLVEAHGVVDHDD